MSGEVDEAGRNVLTRDNLDPTLTFRRPNHESQTKQAQNILHFHTPILSFTHVSLVSSALSMILSLDFNKFLVKSVF